MKKALCCIVLVLLTAFMLTACSSNNGGAAVSGAAPAISAKGGEGTVSSGGRGGSLVVNALEGNNIKITRSGSVDASIDTTAFDQVISSASLTFGAVPLDVTTDMTINTYPSGTAGLTDGQYYMHVGSSALYKYDAAGDMELQVTGLRVRMGAILTLSLNADIMNEICNPGCGSSGYDTANISFPNDVWNEGTITVVDLLTGKDDILSSVTNTADGTVRDMGSIALDTSGVFLNDGTITTKGKDGSGETGGFGGSLDAKASKVMVNRGAADASGGNGTDGGAGGQVMFVSYFGTLNTGSIMSKGGTGSSGSGGGGGRVGLCATGFLAPVYNSGTLNMSGGDGATGGGYAYGFMLASGFDPYYINNYAGGDVVNTGHIVANGGNATDSGMGGSGAKKSSIMTFGGNIRNSAAIEFKGGNGKGQKNTGGQGGMLIFSTQPASDPMNGTIVVGGRIQVSGAITVDGGSGEVGGDSGMLVFEQVDYAGGDIELLGYSNVDLSGGKGQYNGGAGGNASLAWSPGDAYFVYGYPYAQGTIYNEADFNLAGGPGMTNAGGAGGAFAMSVSITSGGPGPGPGPAKTGQAPASQGVKTFVENHGNITAKGGDGLLESGTVGLPIPKPNNGTTVDQKSLSAVVLGRLPGGILLVSDQNIVNTGNLDASGGSASDPALGVGGMGANIHLNALGNISNSGALNTSGGSGALTGGSAAIAEIQSMYGLVVNSGNIAANGGNANALLLSSQGGNGGTVSLGSFGQSMIFKTGAAPILQNGVPVNWGPVTQNTGTLSADAGTGNGPVMDGMIWLDGTVIWPTR